VYGVQRIEALIKTRKNLRPILKLKLRDAGAVKYAGENVFTGERDSETY
jgi:hypothetical protein